MRIELIDIHKTFGFGPTAVYANAGISLTIPSGTIQGILGENGAGKSTLMKILSGFYQANQGEIRLDGKPVLIHSPADALRHGIGMLHQDPLDFPPMRVIDNFLLGSPGRLFPNHRKAAAQFRELARRYEFDLDADAYVDSLTVGERQQLEIIRLLWLGARVLILDEPTTGISSLQKERLFATLRRLTEDKGGSGASVIFVSHKLEDVQQLCHKVAVLRRGRMAGEADAPFDSDQLVELMFNKVITLGERQRTCGEDVTASLDNLCMEDYRLRISNTTLTVKTGEVIGLAGMEGSGQDLFLRALGGLVRPTHGSLCINGDEMVGKPYRSFLHQGVAYMPANRMEEGLMPGMDLTEHFLLAEPQKGMFINWENGRSVASQRIADYSIRGNPASRVEALSGGNQQRALLALLKTPLSLILLEHPTRGLDIESTIYIWAKLKERCRQGAAILFMSSDLEELLQYSDRVLVFFAGKISTPFDADSVTVEQLGQYIGGKGL
jgi:simple sugar transport system ATP-binding protein